jgi:hypothetical protein
MIQMRGDMTPDESCHRNRNATDVAPDFAVAGLTAVLTLAMTIMKTAFAAELRMMTGRRPKVSGKTCPVKIPP